MSLRRVMRKLIGPGGDVLLGAAFLAAATWYGAPSLGHGEDLPSSAPDRCAAAMSEIQADRVLVPLRPYELQPPQIGAEAAAVLDAQSGRLLYERNAHERRKPASTTKIMTAILTIESPLDERMVITSRTDARAMVGSSVMGLWPAATVTVRDLLFGLMLPSGNDAAIELAIAVAGSEAEFVDMMNAKASELGLTNTHFANPHGLDRRDHYSSAADLAVLTRYAMRNWRFRELAATTDYHLSAPFDYDLHNGNSFLQSYPGANGVKIGWTNRAGWTFVASAQRDGREVIVALLKPPDRNADATVLLDWAFTSVTWRETTRRALPMLRMLDALGAPPVLDRWFALCPA